MKVKSTFLANRKKEAAFLGYMLLTHPVFVLGVAAVFALCTFPVIRLIPLAPGLAVFVVGACVSWWLAFNRLRYTKDLYKEEGTVLQQLVDSLVFGVMILTFTVLFLLVGSILLGVGQLVEANTMQMIVFGAIYIMCPFLFVEFFIDQTKATSLYNGGFQLAHKFSLAKARLKEQLKKKAQRLKRRSDDDT